MVFYNKIPFSADYSNEQFLKLEGYLEEKEAKSSLAHFLYNNLGITVELLMGIKLFAFEEIILREWFDHNFNLAVHSRGGAKSTMAAIFCCIYPLFFPETKIVLASNAFRSTRRLILQMEKMINAKGAKLLKACFPLDGTNLRISRRGDEWLLPVLNGGSIVALPLNENIRGTRADVLIIDEALLVPQDIYKGVLLPFLGAQSNITEQLKIDEVEDKLADAGLLKEEEKTILESNKKIIGLTSASYSFEFIYEWYKEWVANITDPKIGNNRSYFVSRLSYKALPSKLIDKSIAEEAKSGGEQTPSFLREWMALFSSSSDSYFSLKKLHQFTVKDGDMPCVQLRGNPSSKYILVCDPNFSNSLTSDMFGMGVYLLNDDARTITLVHGYGRPGGDFSDHLEYFYYLITSFNIVFIVADLPGDGSNFIKYANSSGLFMKDKLELNFIEGDFDNVAEYMLELTKAKNSYNLYSKRICYRQDWKPDWIRMSNEFLQTQIEYGKVHFASRLSGNATLSAQAIAMGMPVKYKDDDGNLIDILDFIGLQDELINQCKCQLALIEPSSKAGSGNITFDLPQHLRRSKSPTRARRDLYSCILMANWGARIYWDFTYNAPSSDITATFVPRMIG